MAQVTIVGVEGSGKTVLMTAMGALYERPDAEGYFLSPENPAAFNFFKMQMDIMRNGRWPAATLTDSLKYLNWSLFQKSKTNQKRIAELSFLVRYVINEFLEYYNHERPHSALGGKMIAPHPLDADGKIMEFSRLGGLLKSYRRVKIAA